MKPFPMNPFVMNLIHVDCIVQGPRLRVEASGFAFRVHGSAFRVQASDFRFQGAGSSVRVQYSECRLQASGFRLGKGSDFGRSGLHFEVKVQTLGAQACILSEGFRLWALRLAF